MADNNHEQDLCGGIAARNAWKLILSFIVFFHIYHLPWRKAKVMIFFSTINMEQKNIKRRLECGCVKIHTYSPQIFVYLITIDTLWILSNDVHCETWVSAQRTLHCSASIIKQILNDVFPGWLDPLWPIRSLTHQRPFLPVGGSAVRLSDWHVSRWILADICHCTKNIN